MNDEEIRDYINLTIRNTLGEIKKSGLMRDSSNVLYAEATELLSNYYSAGKSEASITYAIQSIRFDPYYRIIPLYFEKCYKLEAIAEELGVDISTIVRNKKRLCLEIYQRI